MTPRTAGPFLDRLKAWAAFIGAILTALIASGVIPTAATWYPGLVCASVIMTAVATYAIPNRDDEKEFLRQRVGFLEDWQETYNG